MLAPQELLHTKIGAVNFAMVCSEDDLRHLLTCNWIYEPEIIQAVLSYARPGDTCIDAGANLGYHSLLLSHLVGNSGKVLAFEPDPNCQDKLRVNLDLNAARNVEVIPTALWDKVADYYFFSTACGYSSFCEYIGYPSTRTEVRTDYLDNIINPDCCIRLLKVDCEGAEEKILRGAKKLLQRGVDCVLVEFNYEIMPQCDSTDRQIRDYMHELGYDCYFLYQRGMPPTKLPIEGTLLLAGTRWHFNVMFTRKLPGEWKTSF